MKRATRRRMRAAVRVAASRRASLRERCRSLRENHRPTALPPELRVRLLAARGDRACGGAPVRQHTLRDQRLGVHALRTLRLPTYDIVCPSCQIPGRWRVLTPCICVTAFERFGQDLLWSQRHELCRRQLSFTDKPTHRLDRDPVVVSRLARADGLRPLPVPLRRTPGFATRDQEGDTASAPGPLPTPNAGRRGRRGCCNNLPDGNLRAGTFDRAEEVTSYLILAPVVRRRGDGPARSRLRPVGRKRS